MSTVYFYHLTESPVEQTLPALLQKCADAGWPVVIRGGDAGRMEQLDRALWLAGEGSFLPHGLEGGAHDAVQPVLLCTSPKPAAPGGCLMSVDGAEVLPTEAAGLARICILFDGSDEQAVNHARTQWKKLTDAGLAAQYWAQEQGRWIKKSEKSASNA